MGLEFSDDVIGWIARIVSATAILVVGLWLAFYISKLVRRKATQHPRIDTTLGNFFAIVIRYAIVIVVLLIVLQQFGVQTTSLVAVLGASALAIGLALQGTLTNVASGIMIALIRPYHIGDHVELNGKKGKVTDVDLFFTTLRDRAGQTIMVPNGQAVSNPIINFTRHGQRCCVIEVGVGYEDDLDGALEVMRATMCGDPRADGDEAEPWFGVEELGESAVLLRGRVWVPTADYRRYYADMLKALKEAFDREGIEIPYPHAVEMSKGEVERRDPPIKPAPDRKAAA
jgi:small conductance mechanosensitive channel